VKEKGCPTREAGHRARLWGFFLQPSIGSPVRGARQGQASGKLQLKNAESRLNKSLFHLQLGALLTALTPDMLKTG
jgi:hypothetical protein